MTQSSPIAKAVPSRNPENLAEIAAGLAIEMRASLRENGIQQVGDYLNVLAFIGTITDKNYRTDEPSSGFGPTFARKIYDFVAIGETEKFESVCERIREHKIMAALDEDILSLSVTAGLAGAETLQEAGEAHNISKQEMTDIIVFMMAFVTIASTLEELRTLTIKELVKGVLEKAKMLDEVFPSDEEFFGDFEV